MIFKTFQDLKLSALGFGAMCLPVIDGNDGMIDEAAALQMVDRAMAAGINYYDTAWGYHDGNSELALGRALSRYPRDSFYLATKFPGYDLSNMGKVEGIFEEQLKKCGVGYFDFYLFHNVCEMNIDAYLDEKYGIFAYLTEQKRNGRIKHLGFSAHGGLPVIERFLAAYGKGMEFCQIQLNYLDWEFQGAKAKAELLNQWNIPIWVMEPLRGGRLAKYVNGMGRGGKQLRIALESLPESAQARYRGEVPPPVDILQFTGKQQKKADAKAWVVEQYHQSDLSPAEFVSWFNASNPPEDAISKSKLFRWQKKYQGKNVAALIDQRGGHNRGQDTIPDDAWKMFYSLYMTQQERSVRLCYDTTKLEFLKIPSYKAFERIRCFSRYILQPYPPQQTRECMV